MDLICHLIFNFVWEEIGIEDLNWIGMIWARGKTKEKKAKVKK